ncbi:MAG: hypothetical protein ABH837_00745 [bacterium]
MSLVYRCTDCGNVTRFDKSGDGRCDECGALMNKTSDNVLNDDDKKTLIDKDETGESQTTKTVDLDHNNKDPLSQ